MARTRRPKWCLAAAALILLAGPLFTSIWTERHLFRREEASSFLSSSLAGFQPPLSGTATIQSEKDGILVSDELCGGCYHAVANPDQNVRCGLLIHEWMGKQTSLSLTEAAHRIASDYPDTCGRCRPGSCSQQDTLYWRYDAPPMALPVLASSVLQIASVPFQERIPPDSMDKLEAFFALPNRAVPPSRYLFDYNPSIVVLPQPVEEGEAVYLASFRVSTQQSCFRPQQTKAMYGGSWERKPPIENYLGLALLRDDLTVLQDVVVDLKGSGVFPQAEDFRLFVLNHQVYVASFDYIAPLSITTQPRQPLEEGYVPLTNAFPSLLRVSVREFPSCPVCHNRPNKKCGKNFNYFSTANDNDQQWVELWPTGPHIVQKVDLDRSCSEARKALEEDSLVYSDAGLAPPPPAWYTMEEVWFPRMEPAETLLTRGRGGACCISIRDPRQPETTLLVGTYHTKIPKFGARSGKRLPLWSNGNSTNQQQLATNQYLSRWYAFSATPPFAMVAQSGLFCLGQPDTQEHPLVQTTLWKKMVLGGDGLNNDESSSSLVLECPRIHFVSGIAEKDNDPSKVLVAYGVNDCVSRFIEIEKEDIVRSLFPAA